MKQYIMGIITGASLLACIVIFMGMGTNPSNLNGRYVSLNLKDGGPRILDTQTGIYYGWSNPDYLMTDLVNKEMANYHYNSPDIKIKRKIFR